MQIEKRDITIWTDTTHIIKSLISAQLHSWPFNKMVCTSTEYAHLCNAHLNIHHIYNETFQVKHSIPHKVEKGAAKMRSNYVFNKK